MSSTNYHISTNFWGMQFVRLFQSTGYLGVFILKISLAETLAHINCRAGYMWTATFVTCKGCYVDQHISILPTAAAKVALKVVARLATWLQFYMAPIKDCDILEAISICHIRDIEGAWLNKDSWLNVARNDVTHALHFVGNVHEIREFQGLVILQRFNPLNSHQYYRYWTFEITFLLV